MKKLLISVLALFAFTTHGDTPKPLHFVPDVVQAAHATVASWVLVKVCPLPGRSKPFVFTIVFSDGTLTTFTDQLDKTTRDKIITVLGNMTGRVFTFSCGVLS